MRRVVTGHNKDGKAVFVSDGDAPRVVTVPSLPGIEFLTAVWATEATPNVPTDESDPTTAMKSFVPPPGGTRFSVVCIPPLTRFAEHGTDYLTFRKEYAAQTPGLAGAMEPENPGMHTTDTIDYGVILSGEVNLELDDGEKVLLKPGDTFIQNGTRHAWRNPGTEPCVFAAVMIGATRQG